MVYKWSDLVGQSVANLYVIRAVHSEQQDRAAFVASTGDDGAPVFLELVAPDSPDFEDQRECWLTAASIRHENLVRILRTDGTVVAGKPMLYCVKEPHDEELSTVLASRPLTEAEARDVLRQILPCLERMHRSHYVHGSVKAASVLAFGDRVKLAPDKIHRAGPDWPESDDIHAIGLLVMEMLSGRGAPPHVEQIPSPLRDIVSVCMDTKRRQSLTPADLMRMLQAPAVAEPARTTPPDRSPEPVKVAAPMATLATQPPPPPANEPVHIVAEPPPPVASTRRKHFTFAAAVVAVTLLITVIWQSRRPEKSEPPPAPVTAEQPDVRPSPVVPTDPAAQQQTPPARSATTKPPTQEQTPAPRVAATKPPAPQQTTPPRVASPEPGSWAVIAAAYRSYEAAEKRAESLRRQKQCDCSVFPANGEGRTYYVVVGSGLTKDAAEQLHRQALASRLPSDSYVTRLGDGGTRARQEQ